MWRPRLPEWVDERFLLHRQRSTSVGGLAGVLVAWVLLMYRLYWQGVWSWDLFAVIATMALVKVAVLLWQRFTD